MPLQRPFSGADAEAIVSSMIGTMVHRGPDTFGVWSDPQSRCVLGHRRLSIIDLSPAGRQPMASGDQRWWITFNGEIYNFLELALKLRNAGICIQGRSDTEVLLESLRLWGVDAIRSFDGMFAFAAFNVETGDAILARDPFGEKPLYCMPLPGRGLAFASELQALEIVPGFNREISIDAVAELISLQYIGAPRTIYSA